MFVHDADEGDVMGADMIRVNIRGLEAKPLSGVAGIRQPPPTNCPSHWKAPKNRDQLRKILYSIHSMSNCFIRRLSTWLQTSNASSWYRVLLPNNFKPCWIPHLQPKLFEQEHHHSASKTFMRPDPFWLSILLQPTKVWTLWQPMALRDLPPLLDVCRKKVNND